MEFEIRSLQPADVEDAYAVALAAFADLRRRSGLAPETKPPSARGRLRFDHLLQTDPQGAWVALDADGDVAGCSLALLREGLWGLSLLVVRPDTQSSGIGRELLERAWRYGDGARGAVILASPDHRALRAYARLGLTLHPTVTAKGKPRRVAKPASVRPGEAGDRDLVVRVDRQVRGAAHFPDMESTFPGDFLVLPGRGYVAVREGDVRLLAATDEDAAVLLLQAALAAIGDKEATVQWITSAQSWAVAPCLDAGLDLHVNSGALFVGGDVGPFTPYLPNGAYL
jgi:GNAT superfamily N-acetyltransferase